jgi:CubicO group peptidase (beta-lactamase class C family)
MNGIHIEEIKKKAEKLLNRTPGLAYSIFTANEIIDEQGLGLASIENETSRVTAYTLFRIGSVSKTLTSTLLNKLVEKGLVDLDIPIKQYIPELQLQDKKAEETITLRMLLTHTAGLPDGGDIYGNRDMHALQQFVQEVLPTLTFIAPPNLLYSYGNIAYNLAGYVIERICKKPFARVMKEEIFDPLQMNDTTFDPLVAMTYPIALQHEQHKDGSFRVIHHFPENASCYPSYGCISNIKDMAKVGQMYLKKGIYQGEKILSEATVQHILTTYTNRYSFPPCEVALGWLKEEDKGVSYYWYSGSVGTYRSFFVLFPQHHVGIFIVANQDTGWELVEELIKQLATQKKSPINMKEISIHTFLPLCGKYISYKNGLIELYMQHNEAYIKLNYEPYKIREWKNNYLIGINEENKPQIAIGILSDSTYLMVNGSSAKKVTQAFRQHSISYYKKYCGNYKQGDMSLSFYIEDEKAYILDEGNSLTCTYLFDKTFYCSNFGLLEFKNNSLIIQAAWTFRKGD